MNDCVEKKGSQREIEMKVQEVRKGEKRDGERVGRRGESFSFLMKSGEVAD